MSIRGRLKADQLDGYPNDPTLFLAGQVNADGSNKWLAAAGGVFPQTIAASGSKFIEAYDAATGLFTARRPTEADLSISDITTNNVTSAAHGFAPKSPADATQFMNGAATPAYAAVKDSDLSTSDITTNDVSTSKHGFTPKAPGDATKFLNGANPPAWAVPAGGGSSGIAFLQRATASSSSSLDLASWYSSSYDTYLIIIQGITLSTSANMLIRVSTDSGSTWVSTNSYTWSWIYHYPSGSGHIFPGGTDGIYFRDTSTTLATRGTFDAVLHLHNPAGSNNKLFQGVSSNQVSGATPLMMEGGGYYDSATAVNGVQFLPSTGNLPVGSMTIYGVAKA